MRKALLMTLSLVAMGSELAAQTFVTIVDNLPTCAGRMNGRIISISDGVDYSDCTTGNATGTDRHTVACQCDTVNVLGPYWKAVGGAGGGLPGAGEVTEAMLKAVNSPTDEYNLTYESTTGDFEWQAPATGTIGGTLGATDNYATCADGTGGATAQPCTDQALMPSGSLGAPGISVFGDTNTGIVMPGDGTMVLRVDGFTSFSSNYNITQYHGELFHTQTSALSGFFNMVFAISNGVGSPLNLSAGYGRYLFTNEGVTAKSYAQLHEAVAGFEFKACVQDSDGMRFTAATGDTIRTAASVTTAGGYIESTTIGSCFEAVRLNSTEWMLLSVTGTWSFN